MTTRNFATDALAVVSMVKDSPISWQSSHEKHALIRSLTLQSSSCHDGRKSLTGYLEGLFQADDAVENNSEDQPPCTRHRVHVDYVTSVAYDAPTSVLVQARCTGHTLPCSSGRSVGTAAGHFNPASCNIGQINPNVCLAMLTRDHAVEAEYCCQTDPCLRTCARACCW